MVSHLCNCMYMSTNHRGYVILITCTAVHVVTNRAIPAYWLAAHFFLFSRYFKTINKFVLFAANLKTNSFVPWFPVHLVTFWYSTWKSTFPSVWNYFAIKCLVYIHDNIQKMIGPASFFSLEENIILACTSGICSLSKFILFPYELF